MNKGYNALHSRNEAECSLSYARVGLTADGERPVYQYPNGVHINPDDYAGKAEAERRARETMEPGSREYRESEAREAWHRRRLAEQPGYREAVASVYGLATLYVPNDVVETYRAMQAEPEFGSVEWFKSIPEEEC